MQVSYQLDTAQLNTDFIKSVKLLFGDKTIDIVISDAEDNTSYGIKIPNKETLKAMEEVENKIQKIK